MRAASLSLPSARSRLFWPHCGHRNFLSSLLEPVLDGRGLDRLVVHVGERAGEAAEGFLVLAARQRDEVARQLQQHALLPCGLEILVAAHALVKEGHVDAQGMRNDIEAAGGDPVDALLVFVRLLVGDADQLRHLLLRKAEHDPPFAHPCADVPIDILGT